MNDRDLRNIYTLLQESVSIDPGHMQRVIDELEDSGRRAPRRVRPAALLLGAAAAAAAITIAAVPMTRVLGPDSPTTSGNEGPTHVTPQWPTAEVYRYANELTGVADQDDRFVGSDEQHGSTQITLYGVGSTPPPPVQNLMDQAPAGVNVTWVEVPYTESQLRAAMDLAIESIPGATSASYRTFDHVQVGVATSDPDQLAALQRDADTLDTPVPVRVVTRSSVPGL